MAEFFKTVGKGLLNVILFPLIIVGTCVYGVFGLFVFIFQFFKMIILFFSGRSLNSDLEEDIRANAILNKNNPKEEKDVESVGAYPIYTTDYVSPIANKEEDDK